MNQVIPSRSQVWVRRMWILAVIGLIVAVSPLVPAFIGLALDNRELATYHWVLYLSVPVGGAIIVLSVIAALVLNIVAKSKGQTHG